MSAKLNIRSIFSHIQNIFMWTVLWTIYFLLYLLVLNKILIFKDWPIGIFIRVFEYISNCLHWLRIANTTNYIITLLRWDVVEIGHWIIQGLAFNIYFCFLIHWRVCSLFNCLFINILLLLCFWYSQKPRKFFSLNNSSPPSLYLYDFSFNKLLNWLNINLFRAFIRLCWISNVVLWHGVLLRAKIFIVRIVSKIAIVCLGKSLVILFFCSLEYRFCMI